MTPLASPRTLAVGWCPGALRPMRSGDGLLVRVKPRGQRLSFVQARVVAGLARGHGSGALTLTARGNIQLRGIGAGALPAVKDGLAAVGLLDATPEGEAVRNVISNPLAGHDPQALGDLGAVVARLEERLSRDPAFSTLPAKFSWSVDEGGLLPLGPGLSDIRFAAARTASGDSRLIVGLDGAPNQTAPVDGDPVDAAARLVAAFSDLCAAHGLRPHRMRDLVAACGAPTVFAAAGLAPGEAPPLPRRPNPIGVHRHGASSFLGAAPAFGLLDAAALLAFVQAAERAGAPELRLTPWRSLLASGLSEPRAAGLAAELRISGLILDPDDPRLAVAACIGEPGCHRATTPVPADALRLAAARPGVAVHVSGCAKGCARREAAPITLVGREGRYDLVLGGTAADAPVRAGLSLEAVLALLPALAGEAVL